MWLCSSKSKCLHLCNINCATWHRSGYREIDVCAVFVICCVLDNLGTILNAVFPESAGIRSVLIIDALTLVLCLHRFFGCFERGDLKLDYLLVEPDLHKFSFLTVSTIPNFTVITTPVITLWRLNSILLNKFRSWIQYKHHDISPQICPPHHCIKIFHQKFLMMIRNLNI